MPLSYLDIGLIVIMLLSGLLAMMRGFTREVLSIASWAAAAGATVFAYLRFKDWLRQEIQPNYLADAVLIGGVFLGVLIIVSFITAKISDAILDSRIGALDRTLGFAFGLARGLVIVVIAFLFFSWLVPETNQPRWVREARSRDLLDRTGRWIMTYMPEDPERALQQLRNRGREGESPADQSPGGTPRTQPPSTGQQQRSEQRPAADRQGLGQLVDSVRQQQR
jgi:membrane protein required for colicin V production